MILGYFNIKKQFYAFSSLGYCTYIKTLLILLMSHIFYFIVMLHIGVKDERESNLRS